ncbi:alkylated DNA repair protein alkB homolog 8-like [Asterias rubens]|uniref:alkylated DNA repair protein alkB homolog 8-like n=1 Tax=Asterias rubens TaxID=7604 RepID=UPI0014558783|nr:alkylated DNA repair protein alkB homolog 8-like [Asterias rubens]
MADSISYVKSLPETKLSKSEKKKARKQAKSRHTLLRHEGIHTSKEPTKHLIVGNGGLGNGVSRDDLKPLFSQYGQLTDVVMLPGKPYSVICYSSIHEAISAYENLQAWQLCSTESPASGVILYLSYINEVPRPKMSSGDRSLPPGLILIDDFITPEMEKELMQSVQWEKQESCQDVVQQTLKHRRVQHFGYEFNYATNNIDKGNPLPDPMPSLYDDVISRIMATGLIQFRPDQITVNEYQPGQGIPPHVDTHSAFQDAILSLSLGSQVVMEFTNPTDGRQIPVFVPRLSLMIMTGEARYLWSHGITPRKSDIIPSHNAMANSDAVSDDISKTEDGLTLKHRGVRMSFTFRAVRGAPCHCGCPTRCDTQQSSATADLRPSDPSLPALPTSDLQAMHLEETHVHKVYNNIAGHFSETRHKPWPQVTEFLKELPMGSILLDVGCGNGKYLDGNPGLFSIGCDRSVKLIEICKERRFEAFTCDGLNLSIRNSSVDACICIAVIHHFSTENRRLAAIEEISRVLRPGGLALIYVWAKEQERQQKKSHYITNASHKTKMVGKSVGDTTRQTEDMRRDEKVGELSEGLLNEDVKSPVSEDPYLNCPTSPNPKQDEKGQTNLKVNSVASASAFNARTQLGATNSDFTVENEASDVTVVLGNEDATIHNDNNSTTQSRNNDELMCGGGNLRTEKENMRTALSIHTNRTEFENQDMLVPWHLKKKTSKKSSATPFKENGQACVEDTPVYHRFYHVFQEGELEGLCERVSGVTVKSSHYDQGNWGVVIMKK